MKIVVVSGSPRVGGNSDLLCDQFMAGAVEVGHEAEKVVLQKSSISPCLACYGCRESGICVQKDDMQSIMEKVIEADVVVLSAPVYFYSMSAQMKIFIDRCLPRHQEMENKKFYYVITAADPAHSACDETIAGFRGFLKCLPGAEEKGIIYGTGAWEKGDIKESAAMEEAFQMGRNIS